MLTNRDIFQSVYTGKTQASDGLLLSAWWEHSCLDAPCYFCPHFSTWMNWYLQRPITQTSVSHSLWTDLSESNNEARLMDSFTTSSFSCRFGSHQFINSYAFFFFFLRTCLETCNANGLYGIFKELCSRQIWKKKKKPSRLCCYSPKFPDELVDGTSVRP